MLLHTEHGNEIPEYLEKEVMIMALFEKKVCRHCGKECGVLGRTALKDKSYLCSDCAKKAGPRFLAWESSYEQYLAAVEEHAAYCQKLSAFRIDRQFYGQIFVDEEKDWFICAPLGRDPAVKDLIEACPKIYEGKDLQFFNFFYELRSQEDHLLSSDVKMDIHATVAFRDPENPVPIQGALLKNYKKTADGFFKRTLVMDEEDSLFISYMVTRLIRNGIAVPPLMQKKANKDLDLERYAAYFRTLFALEQDRHLSSSYADKILDSMTAGMFQQMRIRKLFKSK